MSMLPVLHTHDDAIFRPGCHLQFSRTAVVVNDQAVVPCSSEGIVQALHKHPFHLHPLRPVSARPGAVCLQHPMCSSQGIGVGDMHDGVPGPCDATLFHGNASEMLLLLSGSHGALSCMADLRRDMFVGYTPLAFSKLVLLWYTREVFPCITPPGARMIRPPKICPMHWCPMHTPNTGVLGPSCCTIFSEMPESSGLPASSAFCL